jgi:transposase-like protein
MSQPRAPAWTARECAILADVYPRAGINGAADALPDRTWRAIEVRACRLGLRSPVVSNAPTAKLKGAALAEAIRLREDLKWGFARIGATFGVSEVAACNAVTAALCRKNGHRPAARDAHGRLLPEEHERLRLMLRKGLKAIEIQQRMGISASRVAEERRRYNHDLKQRGKAALPPPGGGAAYSGLKLTKAQSGEVETLYLAGLGVQKIHERTGISRTSIVRLRARLVRRLARKGECLPGCDARGRRRAAAHSRRYIPAEAITALQARLLAREPVRRAARAVGIGCSSAYRIRDELAAEMAARGALLPPPVRPGRVRTGYGAAWLPPALMTRHRDLVAEIGLDAATAQIKQEIADAKAAERSAARVRPRTFEEQLAAVRGGAPVVTAFTPRRPDPSGTLGGVATGMLA